MPVHERREHFRIDDQIYFDYKIIETEGFFSETLITDELLGQHGQRYMQTTHYFQELEYELAKLTQEIALKDSALAHYLNLLNAKIDYLAHQLLIGEKVHLRKVNISLGGMTFTSKENLKEKTLLKIVIYTKPKMIPVIVTAIVIYSKYTSEHHYRTAVQFEPLTAEQEQLLSQHVMLAQVKCKSV